MTTLAEFFEREAASSLEQLRTLTASSAPVAAAVHRAARALRGSAQMAREERVYRAALALETAVKPGGPAAESGWSEAGLRCVRAAVEDLAVLIEGSEPSPELDGRLRASLERWQEAGIEMPPPALGQRAPADALADMRAFRAYAGRELEGIAAALEEGMRALRINPLDYEAIKTILRRQRALRGAARLEEIPVVAEILRAVEDLTRVMVRLDVAVKDEWFEVLRSAREGLAAAVPALADDRDPQPSSALTRLRHLRTELLARHGAGESTAAPAAARPAPPARPAAPARPAVPVPPAAAGTPTVPAPPPPTPQAATSAAPVPIELLEYRGAAAQRRALEQRPDQERALAAGPAARAALAGR
ncbi:MAG: hypothetical protein FIB01_05665, partial [Gemmatimonadetes bacterium]|nr:hypothetical protein [Gemmatimonadota bacterium]